ncbi:MAG: hypothetical protein ACYCRH_02185 [Acidiferrobacteraceae bacterium]
MSLNERPGSIMMRGMVIDMNDEQLRTLADFQAFLTGTVAMDCTVAANERYEFIEQGRQVRRSWGVRTRDQRMVAGCNHARLH